MKVHSLRLAAILCPVALVVWWPVHTKTTVLSFRITQTFEDVVRNSTYPVMENSVVPTHTYQQSGETFVTEPAVILCFDDPKHGFILPPTKFAMIGYDRNHVSTVATSPMLEKLAFPESLVLLEDLQNQFKKGGWQPWEQDGSAWFDLSTEGKAKLYVQLLQPPYMRTVELRVPEKYGMTFRLKCAEGCWTREPPYKFLIDVGVSRDIAGWTPGDPMVWDKAHPAAQIAEPGTTSKCKLRGNP